VRSSRIVIRLLAASILAGLILGVGFVPTSVATPADDLETAIELLQEERWRDAAKILGRVTRADPENAEAWFRLGIAWHAAGEYKRALDAHIKSATFPEFESTGLYNAACAYALMGEPDPAFEMLERSQAAGFLNLEHIKTDPDLESLRNDPRFAGLRGYEFTTISLRDDERLDYAVLLPDDFDPDKTYPVLIGMPPGTEGRSAIDFGMTAFWGRQAISRGWVVISPEAPDAGWFSPDGSRYLEALLKDVRGRVRVEGNRFHLVGCSNGGISAFHLAVESPRSFHTLTVIPGAPRDDDFERLSRLKDLRVTMVVGELDDPWLRGAEATAARLEELEVATNLEVVPDEGHLLSSLSDGELIRLLDELRRWRRQPGPNET
jgi:hypothetical protein